MLMAAHVELGLRDNPSGMCATAVMHVLDVDFLNKPLNKIRELRLPS